MAKVKKEQKLRSKFVIAALEGFEKTEAQKIEESVLASLEEAIIECSGQIAYYKASLIPFKELDVKNAELEKVKAEKEYEASRFKSFNKFADYINARNIAEEKLDSTIDRLAAKRVELVILNTELLKFETVLEDLKAVE